MMKIDLFTGTTGPVVYLAEAKDHVRVDYEDDDALLSAYVETATETVEDHCNRALLTQTLDYYLDDWVSPIAIPRPPLQSITSITWRSQGSTAYANTAPSTDYFVSKIGMTPFVELKSNAAWPTGARARTNPIRVRFVAGYGTNPGDVPEPIRTAILLGVADSYEHREDTVLAGVAGRPIMRNAARRLLVNYRVSVS